jgi:hypothetical protein
MQWKNDLAKEIGNGSTIGNGSLEQINNLRMTLGAKILALQWFLQASGNHGQFCGCGNLHVWSA